ncbi:MAG: hypothetical protein M3Q29_11465 [Chloroflexota bacterium]|nr:hypothetical protein [Chloroflexota bacterium]
MPMPKQPPMRELHFGQLDAHQEAIDEPELLLAGFYDYREAAYGIATGATWLLLGPKGAGKSAVFEHLRLEWQARWDRFLTIWDLRDFPVNDVTQIRTGQSPGAARAQAAWEFLLLLRIYGSLCRDETLEGSKSFAALHSELKKAGLLDADWRSKVVEWSKVTATFNLQVAELGIELSNSSVGALEVTDVLRRVLATVNVTAGNRHVVVLDGLDSFFFEVEDEWTSLAGLMHAIEATNRFLRDNRLQVSVTAAVRSDVFDVLPSAESNKLKPHSVQLDWSALGIGAGNHLWRLVSAKAAAKRPGFDDVVSAYMKGPIHIGPHSEMAEYFLDYTRLLPRDLVALMGYVQTVHPGSSLITEYEAREAVGRYSQDYFAPEIFNNLAGTLKVGSALKLTAFRNAMRTIPKRTFVFDDVQGELEGELEPAETKQLLRQMFEIGGIGIRNESGRIEYTDFVYRRVSGAGFTTRYGFLLHNSLVVAWNRPWA